MKAHNAVYRQSRKRYGRTPRVKRWRQAYNRQYQMQRYGISEERFLELVVEQKGLCAMCERKLATSNEGSGKQRRTLIWVDHDHETKKVRALVCPRCNTLLGLAKDDRKLLRVAIDYLSRHSVEVIPDEPANGPLAQP